MLYKTIITDRFTRRLKFLKLFTHYRILDDISSKNLRTQLNHQIRIR